jgi:periplasmic protein TonB
MAEATCLLRSRAEQRRVATAVGLSLSLHTVVLALLPDWRLPEYPSTASIIHVFVVPQTKLVTTAPPSSPTPAVVANNRPAIARTQARASARAAPTPALAPPAPAPAAPASEPTVAATREQHPPAALVPAAARHHAALTSYARTLTDRIAQHRRYPRLAQLRRMEGEVQMQLRIAAGGALVDVRITRSSGFELLDRHALDMVTRAQPLPTPPETMRAPDLTVLVPVVFRLKS